MPGDITTPATIDPLSDRASARPRVAPESGSVTSVVICDDRGHVRKELARALGQILLCPAAVDVRLTADGVALLDSFETRPADLLLIGIHSGDPTGIDGLELMLATHPSAVTIVYGSLADVDVLAAAYARGAGGMLLWEPKSSAGAVPSSEATTPVPGDRPDITDITDRTNTTDQSNRADRDPVPDPDR